MGATSRAFTVEQARRAGVSDGVLYRSGLRQPTRGVRTVDAPPERDDVVGRCREFLPALPRAVAFSHATAVDLWGIDRPRGLRRPDDLHILVPHAAARPQRKGVVAHCGSLAGRRRARSGLPVVGMEQTWVQLAAELSPQELVVLGDAMLRRRGPWTSVRQLTDAVARMAPGTRGVARAREALPLLRAGTDSCQETRLRLVLIAGGLPTPRVNEPVFASNGTFIALPDLSFPDDRVAIEYDGDLHRTDRSTWQRDVRRRRMLDAAGWAVISCTAHDISHPTNALTAIYTTLRSHRRR